MRRLNKIKDLLFGPKDRAQAGETLLSLLITIGLSSIFIYEFTTSIRNIIVNRMHLELRREKNNLKQHIVNNVDCRTFDFSCNDNDAIILRNFNGEILVADTDTNFVNDDLYGSWSVRAICQNNRPVIQFALKDQDNAGSFLTDPKTKRVLNWSEPTATVAQDFICRTDQVSGNVTTVVGQRCDWEARRNGTQLGPLTGSPIASPWYPAGVPTCNPNGADAPKPSCTSGTEWYSYWDRNGNWGASGSWVVLCK